MDKGALVLAPDPLVEQVGGTAEGLVGESLALAALLLWMQELTPSQKLPPLLEVSLSTEQHVPVLGVRLRHWMHWALPAVRRGGSK